MPNLPNSPAKTTWTADAAAQWTDPAPANYRQRRIRHWDTVAKQMDTWRGWGGAYHRRLTEVYRLLVPPGQRVLEVGCAQGDLLAALEPSLGVGVDFSLEMLRRATERHPDLRFVLADAHEVEALGEPFDVIVLSDLVNDVWDVQDVLERIVRLTRPETRVILNYYSHLWELPLALAQRLGLGKPTLYQNWLTIDDIVGLLNLAGLEVVRRWSEILWPVPTPVLGSLANRYLVKLWPFRSLALTNFLVARPRQPAGTEFPSVSVVIPARNEAGNIGQILARTPEMGRGTELIFVEGHSKDDTYGAIERAIATRPERRCRLFRQTGRGKGDAVKLGFARASGDILMILDADLTVPPEDLPRFYDILCSRQGEFANGVRLVYPMEGQAMRFANLVGNKCFSMAFSWLLGQPIKDTLCGTKVLWKSDYDRIAANRGYFGDFDPFGDYDLLFGAARLNLKITDVPIRYRERTYGTTSIQRWSHGWLLLRMILFAAFRIKFV
jgi:SAM-dependent methyltransferase